MTGGLVSFIVEKCWGVLKFWKDHLTYFRIWVFVRYVFVESIFLTFCVLSRRIYINRKCSCSNALCIEIEMRWNKIFFIVEFLVECQKIIRKYCMPRRILFVGYGQWIIFVWNLKNVYVDLFEWFSAITKQLSKFFLSSFHVLATVTVFLDTFSTPFVDASQFFFV